MTTAGVSRAEEIGLMSRPLLHPWFPKAAKIRARINKHRKRWRSPSASCQSDLCGSGNFLLSGIHHDNPMN
jgi:hypothetical protein